MQTIPTTYHPIPYELMIETLNRSAQSALEYVRPRTKLLVSQWAERYRHLSPEDCDQPGPYSFVGFEFLREPQDCFNHPDIREITMMKSGQTGMTQAVLNMIGYSMDMDPAPWLVIYPTETKAQRFSKKKLSPMIRDSKKLRGLVQDSRKRNGSNAILEKSFPGGSISMVGGNSANSFDSQSIKYLTFDEKDRLPREVSSEGDSASIARKRIQGYSESYKIINISTPSEKGRSYIEEDYKNSDQRKYYVPCPHCGHMQTLRFEQLKRWRIEKGVYEPEKVYYECENVECKAHITERDKVGMVEKGKWIAENPSVKDHAGFFINELYSPLSTWEWVIKQFIKAKDDILKLRAFENLVLGNCWEHRTRNEYDTNEIMRRCEHYGPELDENIAILTAAVDVQGDRLEMKVKGFGLNEESWLIDYRFLVGETNQRDVWDRLELQLLKKYRHATGVMLPIYITLIDSQYRTDHVSAFVRKQKLHRRKIYASKGKGGLGLPVVTPRIVKSKGLEYYQVGTDAGKEMVYSRLSILEYGQGYMHFPHEVAIDPETRTGIPLDKEYFEQLTAEKIVTTYHKGQPKEEWAKIRTRNEALDLEVMCLAGFYLTQLDNSQIEKILEAYQSKASKEEPKQEDSADESIRRRNLRNPKVRYRDRWRV